MDIFSNLSLVNTICIGVLWGVAFVNRNHIIRNNSAGGTSYFSLWLTATLFSVFYMPVDGDVYNGYLSYHEYVASGVQYHMEPIYFWLIDHLPHNFYIYRFVIWGTASLFMVMTFKKLNCQSPLAMLVFISSCLIVCYYYLRNVLGFSILYYVVASICMYKKEKHKRPVWDYIIYALLLVAAFFLHRSMPIYYAVVLLALFMPTNRYVILAIGVALPAISILVPSIIPTVLQSGILDQETAELGANYLEYSEGYDFNFMGRLLRFFWLLPYIYIMVIAVFTIPAKSSKERNPVVVFLLISVFLFSSSFLFASQYSYSLHLRLLHTSFMPMIFFITKYLEDKRTITIGRIFTLLVLTYYGMVIASRII